MSHQFVAPDRRMSVYGFDKDSIVKADKQAWDEEVAASGLAVMRPGTEDSEEDMESTPDDEGIPLYKIKEWPVSFVRFCLSLNVYPCEIIDRCRNESASCMFFHYLPFILGIKKVCRGNIQGFRWQMSSVHSRGEDQVNESEMVRKFGFVD